MNKIKNREKQGDFRIGDLQYSNKINMKIISAQEEYACCADQFHESSIMRRRIAQLLYMVRSGLEDMIGGYEVLTAVNGKEGLQQWKEQAPDIIVSDIEMPVMNGYEMVSRIRKTEKTLPIIFASGFDKPANVIHGYNVGVSNYIKKPYTPEELNPHIKAIFRR